jgi:hypothetical protein
MASQAQNPVLLPPMHFGSLKSVDNFGEHLGTANWYRSHYNDYLSLVDYFSQFELC